MRGREAVTERVGASQAKRDWSKVINRAFSGKFRFVVEKHGTPVAGIVSADDIERWPNWMRSGSGISRFWSGLAGRFVTRLPSRLKQP